MRWRWGLAAWLAVVATLASPRATAEPIVVDRALIRFTAPELGGVAAPRFIFERALAFESRLEALADSEHGTTTYRERHVYAAMERHIAETLLEGLRIDPEPSEAELERQTEVARAMLVERVGGAEALSQVQSAEGISARELTRILRRQARASLYLDRMIAPMLRPSDAELAAEYQTEKARFRGLPYADAIPALRRIHVARRLSAAVAAFYQNARTRLRITVLEPLP